MILNGHFTLDSISEPMCLMAVCRVFRRYLRRSSQRNLQNVVHRLQFMAIWVSCGYLQGFTGKGSSNDFWCFRSLCIWNLSNMPKVLSIWELI